MSIPGDKLELADILDKNKWQTTTSHFLPSAEKQQ